MHFRCEAWNGIENLLDVPRILEGTAAFRIAGMERTAAVGETVIVPPGTPHLAWNSTQGVVRLRITMQPALRWAEFVESVFAGEDAAVLLSEFSREIRLA